MNIGQAKTFLRGFARTGCVRTTKHCRERMAERNVTTDDILHVLMWGEIVELEEDPEYANWTCKVKGQDLDGEDLTFVAAIDRNENAVLCITVF